MKDFRNAVQGLLPGSQTDDAVDESIAESGGGATAQALRQEQAEKKASRNPFKNFFYGKIMGEDAEYDRQIRRAEEAQGTETSGTPPVRSTTPMLPGVRPKGTGTEGDPVVEGDMIENTY